MLCYFHRCFVTFSQLFSHKTLSFLIEKRFQSFSSFTAVAKNIFIYNLRSKNTGSQKADVIMERSPVRTTFQNITGAQMKNTNRKYKATKRTGRLNLCPAKRIMIIYTGHDFGLNFLTILWTRCVLWFWWGWGNAWTQWGFWTVGNSCPKPF